MSVFAYEPNGSKVQREQATAANDAQLLKANGYDIAVLQEKMKSIFATVFDEEKKSQPKWGFKYEIGDVKVKYSLARARCTYNCDWDKHVTSSPRDYTIKNKKTGETIDGQFDDHALHQIGEHGFFGHDRYRVDPLKLARIILGDPVVLEA